MRKPSTPESKILEILAEQTAGASVAGIVKKHKISSATFYTWKSKYGAKGAAPAKRGRPKGSKSAPHAATAPAISGGGSLGQENQYLRELVVDLMLENARLKGRV